MSDYQRIADDVGSFIEATDQTRDPALEALAEAYALACKEVNARLRRCGDLLHRGLRSEALHLAQESPDLLDSVAALDISGIEVWEENCAMYGLAKSSRMLLDVAAELNDAYALEEPLQASLDELRLLAIARAPAHARLLVTRRLRALDIDTPHWTEDAVALERVCLNGVRQDVATVLKSGDPNAVRRLTDDLTSPDWISRPPKDLIDPLIAAELQGLVQNIVREKSAGNLIATRRAFDTLQRTLQTRKAKLSSRHATDIGEASAWLAQQDELAADKSAFDELCASLVSEIRNDAPRPHIEALWKRVTDWGLPVADNVLDVYERSKFRSKTISNRTKLQLLLAVVVVIVLVAAGVWALIGRQRDSSAARAWLATVSTALAQYDFAPAEQAWTTLSAESPSVATRSEVAAAHAALEASSAAEAKRLRNLKSAIDDASVESAPTNVRAARVAAAELYVRTAAERQQVRDLRERLATVQPATVPSSNAAPAESSPAARDNPPAVSTAQRPPESKPTAPVLSTAMPSTIVPAAAAQPVIKPPEPPVAAIAPAKPANVAKQFTWTLPLAVSNAEIKRVVYVCDTAGSLDGTATIARVQQQLADAIAQLDATQGFSVILFRGMREAPSVLSETPTLQFATAENKANAAAMLERFQCGGHTDPTTALRTAFRMKPESVFLIVDSLNASKDIANDLAKIATIGNVNKNVRLNIILLGTDESQAKSLAVVAADNSGQFISIADVDHSATPAAVEIKAAEPASSTPTVKTILDKDVSIPAKVGQSDTSVALGKAFRGQHIRLRYVRGEWTAFPRNDYPAKSPDDEPVAHENVLRPRLCEIVNGEVRVLATLPGKTKQKPFELILDHDVGNLVINTSDARPQNNVGEVVYHVLITDR